MTRAIEVLIVEDETLLAMDIEAMVEDSGHHVLAEATSLHEVEQLSIGTQPHLALVDLHLSDGSDGIQVCELIRMRWPDALVIFVTANDSKLPEDLAGAHGVIAKPLSQNGILRTIKYLAEGVLDPPPSSPPPTNLVTSPELQKRWAFA